MICLNPKPREPATCGPALKSESLIFSGAMVAEIKPLVQFFMNNWKRSEFLLIGGKAQEGQGAVTRKGPVMGETTNGV